ncbi:MAG: SMC-Scp complex subunit ScpB [Ferruginibacter sp.]
MELSLIIPHIEALIFASEKPLTNLDLVELLNNAMGFIEDRATLDQVETAVDGIFEKYNSEFYAFELKQSGGGWQFLTKKEYHKTVAQLNGDKFLKRLSTAALETLAIIAYKQPITKSEIESIRGVNCDYAVQKLLEKDLVIIAGRNEEAVGKPLIYTTSKSFMDYFGINSTADLPKISEVLMEEMVQATKVNPDAKSDDDDDEYTVITDMPESALAVTETGDLIEEEMQGIVEVESVEIETVEIDAVEVETVEIEVDPDETIESELAQEDMIEEETTEINGADLDDASTDNVEEETMPEIKEKDPKQEDKQDGNNHLES